MARGKQPMRTLLSRVAELVDDPDGRIRHGEVLVGGTVVTNPASMVPAGVAVAIREERVLRGRRKLGAALAHWDLALDGAVALDAGAAAGGFTQALLDAGAARVYAVEVGYGQLLGSLRQDPRVVGLERTNIGELTTVEVPDALDVVSLDLGYLSLASGVPQLSTLRFAERAELIALVKPMFELGLASPPSDRPTLDKALAHATTGIESAGWRVLDWIDSPVGGSKGAHELFVRARFGSPPGEGPP
jgi:23S rRNA (cytidine1920-2'-O)/16S rRNA (cytidine1409-2'-O)-methyltransferase